MNARRLALALCLLLALPALAHAGQDRRGDHGDRGGRHHGAPAHGPVVVPEGVSVPTWDQLTPAQQKSVERLRERWDTLPASQRVMALERAERRARWAAMTPEQRERIREGMRNYRDLPPELRETMRESMRAMRALPEAERRELFAKWRALSPEQRRAWLEAGGPGLVPQPAQAGGKAD